MGFYAPATLVKDAQRHGLHFQPIDVTRSQWFCTIEEHAGERQVRLGLNYVKGLREETARAILRARAEAPFASIQDVVRRVPGMRKDELRKLSEIGALNYINQQPLHRRAALWESEAAIQPRGPLFDGLDEPAGEFPLSAMTPTERLNADFRGTHVTIGKHPMAFHRPALNALKVVPAYRLKNLRNGTAVRIAGCVICRQRPGTAKGLVFLSLEDETGISNAVLMPDVFERQRVNVVGHSYILIEGELQNVDGVTSVKTASVQPLALAEAGVPSHDFH